MADAPACGAGGRTRALSVYLGAEAARRIAADGWQPDLFDVLVGASGGAKWFILGHLDRLLFGDFLARGERPLNVLGSSIGTWRHACLAQPDPVGAIDRLEQGYLHQRYASRRPSVEEISEVSLGILDSVLGTDGARHIAEHPRIRTHIVTARGRGPAASRSNAMLAAAMGTAAMGNAVSRSLLRLVFQRVVFHSGATPDPGLHLGDFHTAYAALDAGNTRAALHASGSIPFVLTGERDIAGAPSGHYWDGGIIDYHFDLGQYQSDGLLLYPHFGANVIPGWFDKFLPWRRAALHEVEKLVLVCPSEAFIADLPHGKIPDRSDFRTMREHERLDYWQTCIERSRALAEEFRALIEGDDPLAGAVVLN
ncbi:MAG: patatin-like phospholipase family protein [Halioglobus sp.]|nr:patatin-like phospholipase family protein [Halioglobus sp.]